MLLIITVSFMQSLSVLLTEYLGLHVAGQRPADHLDDYIKKYYIPTNILFREPTKMGSAQVGNVLQFWRQRQQWNPQDIFHFSKWKDNDGCFQRSCLDSDTDEKITDGPIQAEATGDHHEQAVTGTVF